MYLQDMQQYTRRNALRIYNPSWIEPWSLRENEQDDTDKLVLELNQKPGVQLAPWEIGRSHRVGRPESDVSPMPFIIKFIAYNICRRMYEARDGCVYIWCTPEDKPVVIRDMNVLIEKSGLSRPQPRPAQEDRPADSSSTMSEFMFRLPPPMSMWPIPKNAITSTPSGAKPDEAPADVSRFAGGCDGCSHWELRYRQYHQWTGYDCRARPRTIPWRLGMLIIYRLKETSIAES